MTYPFHSKILNQIKEGFVVVIDPLGEVVKEVFFFNVTSPFHPKPSSFYDLC